MISTPQYPFIANIAEINVHVNLWSPNVATWDAKLWAIHNLLSNVSDMPSFILNTKPCPCYKLSWIISCWILGLSQRNFPSEEVPLRLSLSLPAGTHPELSPLSNMPTVVTLLVIITKSQSHYNLTVFWINNFTKEMFFFYFLVSSIKITLNYLKILKF